MVKYDLIVLGEAPGKTEEAEGRPFAGRCSFVRDAFLEYRVYYTNVFDYNPGPSPSLSLQRTQWDRLAVELFAHDVHELPVIALGKVAQTACDEVGLSCVPHEHPSFVLRFKRREVSQYVQQLTKSARVLTSET